MGPEPQTIPQASTRASTASAHHWFGFAWRISVGRAKENPAVLLLDLKLPKVNGLEVVQQVEPDERPIMIPVVVLTSSREEKDMVASYQVGVNAYVVKPIGFHEFVPAIKELGIFWAVVNEPPFANVGKR